MVGGRDGIVLALAISMPSRSAIKLMISIPCNVFAGMLCANAISVQEYRKTHFPNLWSSSCISNIYANMRGNPVIRNHGKVFANAISVPYVRKLGNVLDGGQVGKVFAIALLMP